MAKKEKEGEVTLENPNLGEEGTEGTDTPKEEGVVDQKEMEALIAELEKAGVTNTEQLHNKLAVTKEYGNVVNMLGELKAENKQLKEMLELNQKTGKEFDFSEASSEIDLARMLDKVLDERESRKAKQQQEYNKAVMAMWNKIQTDTDYNLVKDVWENKTKDPNFIFMVQQGQVNPWEEYNNTVREYYKGIAKRSLETIKTIHGGGRVNSPHVESGEARLPGVKPQKETTAQEERLSKLREKVDKGEILNEDEQVEALLASLSK